MSEKKKILDVDSRNFSDEAVNKLKSHLREYKYQINYQQQDGRIRYAYTNDEPELVAVYMKSINAKILKITEVKK